VSASDKNLTIHFIRHGQSWGNVEEKPPFDYDKEDPPLTPLGKLQSEKLASRFTPQGVDIIFSSPMIRTVQTIYPSAQRCGKKIEILPALIEKSTRTQGIPLSVLQSDYPLVFFCDKLPHEASDRPFAHEEPEEAGARAEAVVSYIKNIARDGDTVLVSTHGTFLSYLMRAALGLNAQTPFRFQADNTGVFTVRFYSDEETKLCYADDVRHLLPEEIT